MICYECLNPTTPSRSRPVVKYHTGPDEPSRVHDVVCMKCWRELEYGLFLRAE